MHGDAHIVTCAFDQLTIYTLYLAVTLELYMLLIFT